MKIVTELINSEKVKFIVTTADADNAVHVHVEPHPDYLGLWNSFTNPSKILERIATETAEEINPKAYNVFAQVKTSNEWQGQFDFD